jgi:hypothetical protein
MHRLALTAIALTGLVFTTLGVSSTAALAGHVTISGTHSTSEIKSKCDGAGGSFYSSGGVYGCFGPGGDVTCNQAGKCFGTCSNCQARMVGKIGIAGVLTSPTAGLKQPTAGPGTRLTTPASGSPMKPGAPAAGILGTTGSNLTTSGSSPTATGPKPAIKQQDLMAPMPVTGPAVR